MSRKTSSSITDRNMEKSVGASTPPCLTPFVTPNDSETSPPTLTFAIIPVCRASIIVVNFSGHPYLLSSCHSPVLPNVSNALLKSTNTMYSGLSSSMHFSCRCWRQNISTVLRLPLILKPHYVSGTTFGIMWVDSLLRRIGEDLVCYGTKRDSSIVPTVCSITFLVDGYNAGILPCLWYRTHLPCIGVSSDSLANTSPSTTYPCTMHPHSHNAPFTIDPSNDRPTHPSVGPPARQSNCLPIHPSIHPVHSPTPAFPPHSPVRRAMRPSIQWSPHPSIHPSGPLTHPCLPAPFTRPSGHPPVHPMVSPSTHSPTHPSIHPRIHPFTHASIHSPTHPSVHPRIHPFTHASIHSPTHPSIHPFNHPFTHASIH